MTQKMQNRQQQLVSEFQGLPDWERRYQRIIEKGKALSSLEDSLKVDEALVRGCQSKVWLHAKLDEQGRVVFQADSDAMIVRGLVALLLSLFSDATPEEILQTSPVFIEELGLGSHLSPSRANGLAAMIKQMKFFALAFQQQQVLSQ